MGYGKTDPAEAQKFQDRLTRGNWFKPKEGSNKIRVLPPGASGTKWWHEWTIHWRVGPQRTVVPCLQKHGSGQCAVCEAIATLLQQGDTESLEMADQMKAQWKVLVNILDLASPSGEVVQLLAGQQIISGLVGYDTDEEYGGIDDPKVGFDMNIMRGPAGTQPLYAVRASREQSAILDLTVLDDMPDIAKGFRVYTYEEQQALLGGGRVKNAPVAADPTSAPTPSPAPTPGPAPGAAAPSPSAPTAESAPAPIPSASAAEPAGPKPRCLGKESEYDADDPICQKCTWFVKCGGLVTGPVAVTAPAPRCFGKMYTADDADCKVCTHLEGCQKAM